MFIVDLFWNGNVWLPPNVTWDDIAPGPDKPVNYNNHYHIWFSLPLALMFIGLQTAFERVMTSRFSRWMGLSDRSYHKAAYPPKWRPSMTSPDTWNRIKGVIDRWRDSHYYWHAPSPLNEFCQSVWNFIFYISIFIFGTNLLRNKKWLWDLDQCYVGYPHHGITNDVWLYYVISLAFYWTLLYRVLMSSLIWYKQFNHFWHTMVHHITTITLLYLSWVCNLHRIGTLVLLCHNVSDVFLESFKAAKSAHRLNFRDILLLMLMISWISTRIIVFPYYIIWSTMFRAPNLMAMFPAYYIFNSLLCLLFALHILRGPQNLILIVFYDNIEPYTQRWRKQSFTRTVKKKKEYSASGRDTTKDDNKMTWDKLYLLTDVNDYVDMAISQLVPLMKKSGLDPMDLTDVIGGLDKQNRGQMTGLANVKRFGDQRIRFMDNKLSIRLQFQFTNLELLYTYMSLLAKNIEGSLDRFRISFDLVIDFDNEKPLSLQEFSLTDMSEIRVQLSSHFLIERSLNSLSTMFTNIFHKAIVDAVQCNIADAIQDGLDFVNANIKNVVQSMILYSLFQDKKVSNLIIDRYAQWKKNKKTSESQTDVNKTNELKKNK